MAQLARMPVQQWASTTVGPSSGPAMVTARCAPSDVVTTSERPSGKREPEGPDGLDDSIRSRRFVRWLASDDRGADAGDDGRGTTGERDVPRPPQPGRSLSPSHYLSRVSQVGAGRAMSSCTASGSTLWSPQPIRASKPAGTTALSASMAWSTALATVSGLWARL